MGRAGRSREIQAVFTLWLQKSIRIKTNDSLAIYRSPIKDNDPATKAILSSIIDFEEKVDQLAARFGSNVLDKEEVLIIDNLYAGDEAMDLTSISRNSPKDPHLRFNRGILALGSNTGCYQALFLKYFHSKAEPLISRNYCYTNCASNGMIPEGI